MSVTMAQAEVLWRTVNIPCAECRVDPPRAGWFGVHKDTGKLIPLCNAVRHRAPILSNPFTLILSFQKGVGSWIVQEVMESWS